MASALTQLCDSHASWQVCEHCYAFFVNTLMKSVWQYTFEKPDLVFSVEESLLGHLRISYSSHEVQEKK